MLGYLGHNFILPIIHHNRQKIDKILFDIIYLIHQIINHVILNNKRLLRDLVFYI